MGSSASIPKEKHIVIVGGGYAGTALATAFKKRGAKFTLISAQDAMFHNIASVRSLVEPGFAAKTLIPLSQAFGDQFKHEKVTGINPDTKKVMLDGGGDIDYDVLILATGSCGPFPFKLKDENIEAILPVYDKWRQRVEISQRIVIVGGGPTGVEQAAEIAYKFPDKEVTLIHSRETLVVNDGSLTTKFQNKLQKILSEELKINIILGEKVDNIDSISGYDVQGPITVRTSQGQQLECDLVLKCTGLTFNSDAYKDSLGNAVTETGELKVNGYFQVDGYNDIYAVGDCAKVADRKLAYIAGLQSEYLAKALARLLKGEKPTPYKAGSAPLVVALAVGPNHGLAQTTGGIVLPEFIIKSLKSKDLAIKRTWNNLGLKAPS